MNEKLTPEQIADDVAFIIQREMPDDVHSVDVAEIISAVQHYIIQQLTANTAVDEVVEIVGMNGNAMEFHLSDQLRNHITLRKIDEYWLEHCSHLALTDIPEVWAIVNWLQQEAKDE